MTSHYDPAAEPTIWRIPADLWEEYRALLPLQKAAGTPGRPVVPFRRVLDGILPVLRTGCQWKAVSPEFGSGSTCHRRFQEWIADGTWERLWADQLGRYDAEQGSGWDWQSADSATVPSPLGGDETGPHPTNRGKRGTKRPVLTDRRGAPLGAVISAANRNDMKVAEATLDSVVVARPQPTPAAPQHLCRDASISLRRARRPRNAATPSIRPLRSARARTRPHPRQRRSAIPRGAGSLNTDQQLAQPLPQAAHPL